MTRNCTRPALRHAFQLLLTVLEIDLSEPWSVWTAVLVLVAVGQTLSRPSASRPPPDEATGLAVEG